VRLLQSWICGVHASSATSGKEGPDGRQAAAVLVAWRVFSSNQITIKSIKYYFPRFRCQQWSSYIMRLQKKSVLPIYNVLPITLAEGHTMDLAEEVSFMKLEVAQVYPIPPSPALPSPYLWASLVCVRVFRYVPVHADTHKYAPSVNFHPAWHHNCLSLPTIAFTNQRSTNSVKGRYTGRVGRFQGRPPRVEGAPPPPTTTHPTSSALMPLEPPSR
jgi:hypothetical protein